MVFVGIMTTSSEAALSKDVVRFHLRVTVITWGVFHSFELARELLSYNALACVFSPWPWLRLQREGLPRELVCSGFWGGALLYLGRLGLPSRLMEVFNRKHALSFAKRIADRLPECSGVIALSGSGLEAGRKIQSRGGFYICDRASTHLRYQTILLKEEYRKFKLSYRAPHESLIEREEEEYETADRILVPSGFVKKSFLEMGVEEKKIVKIPYGVNFSKFFKVADPPKDEFCILFAGQVGVRKGIPYLLEAFAKLKVKKKRLRIAGSIVDPVLRGPGPDGVEYLGPVSQSTLRELMSRSHVFVLPSVEEGLAYVLGEAMACGCPVVATRNTGAEDLFTDGVEGYIVEPRCPEAICQKLEILASHPSLREEMGEAALQRVGQLQGWNTYGQQVYELCQSLVGREFS